MRILLAGATGVIGKRLLPRLIAAGHEVTCLTRSEERAAAVRATGAEAVVADALDERSMIEAAKAAHPDAVINQLTSIPERVNPRRIASQFAANDLLRVVGTRNLVAAAAAAGAQRLISQSIAFVYAPEGDAVKSEDAPLHLRAPGKGFRRMVDAVAQLEAQTIAAPLTGVVLRYGVFYGPGTTLDRDGHFTQMIRGRKVPIVGGGAGVHSFIHIDDAAAATIAALAAPAGVFNVVDDEPAPIRDWLPTYAAQLGARPPMRVPTFLGWLGAGSYGVYMMKHMRGASNRRARDAFGWTPAIASWRTGLAS